MNQAALEILTNLAAEHREALLEFQAKAVEDPDLDLALFPDLRPEREGSNAWLAYMEYDHEERGDWWEAAAQVSPDGAVWLAYGDAVLDVLPAKPRRQREPQPAPIGPEEDSELPFE